MGFKKQRIMIILRPFMRDKRRRRSSPLSKCSMFCSISGRSRVFSWSQNGKMGPTGSRTIVPAGSNFTGPGARGQLASVFRGGVGVRASLFVYCNRLLSMVRWTAGRAGLLIRYGRETHTSRNVSTGWEIVHVEKIWGGSSGTMELTLARKMGLAA